MPLYSEHIANIYYGGSPTYTGGSSYGYSGKGTSYSAPYLNTGSNYSTHSSLGSYSRAPLTTRWITSSGRSYSPMLSTISERGNSSPVRINSPRRIPLLKRSYGTPTYTPRPININTADIDVSRDKYNHRRKSPSPISPKNSPLKENIVKNKSPPKATVDEVSTDNESCVNDIRVDNDKDSGPFMPRIDGKPETGIDSSPGKQRSTIKRGRTVVRLHTIKRKDRDSPRKPAENSEETDLKKENTDENSEQTESIKWRDKLADDLVYNDKREKKSLGTKLAEKFLLKEKDTDEVVPRKWETQQSAENVSTSENCQPVTPQFQDRRCSLELLAEQANLLDSLIQSENLSTATLDLTKVGVEEEPHASSDTYQSIKRRKSNHKNPLKTTKSVDSLHDTLNSFRDQKQISKRRSLRKSLSGGSICRLDSITEMPKEPISANLPLIEEIEKRLSIKQVQPKVKPKVMPKITSSVEISAPVSPLKFKIENVTVEEKSHVPKKEITFSSVVIEDETKMESECGDETVFNFEPRPKSIKTIQKSIPSPEPDDGNFWDKIGKRETVYLLKRKQNIEESKEKQRRALFWFPEDDDEINNVSDVNSPIRGGRMRMSYKPQNKNDSIYQDCPDRITAPKDTQHEQQIATSGEGSSSKSLKDKTEESIKKGISKNEPALLPSSSNDASDITNTSSSKQEETANIAKQDIEANLNKKIDINNDKENITKNLSRKSLEKQEEQCKLESNKEVEIKKIMKDDPKPIPCNKVPCTKKEVNEPQQDTNITATVNITDSDKKIDVDKTPPDIFEDAIALKDNSLDLRKETIKTTDVKSEVKEKAKQITLNSKNKSQSKEKDNSSKSNSKKKEAEKKDSPKNSSKCNSKKKEAEKKDSSKNSSKCNSKKKEAENKDSSKKELKVSDNKSNTNKEIDKTNINNKDKLKLDNIPIQVNSSNVEIIKTGEDNKADQKSQKEKQDAVKSDQSHIKDSEIDSKSVHNESNKDDNISSTAIKQAVPQNENPQILLQKSDEIKTNTTQQEKLSVEEKKEDDIKRPSPIVKLPTAVVKKPLKDEPALRPLIATPRPLQKKSPQVIHSSSSSDTSSEEEDSSDEEEEDESDTSEGSTEFFECENNTDGRTSTGSNDSGFDSSAPTSPAGFVQIKKGADSPGPSSGSAPSKSDTSEISERELEQSTAYGIFRKTGRFTPPARSIPRFRKYTVEDFQFIKVLGKGSFGKVLLAELKDTEYYYAVKCLKKDVVLEDDDVECTLIERKVLALGTNHPYLCHLFATFQTDSHLFFVMEYLNGGDLMFHIQQSGRFPEARARFYAAEIVSGLKFLHKRGIVYRDLKLDNILLDFDGHVRIADFGMCKLQIYLEKTADTFCGTPDYMAPEIIKGLKYNQTVDWWSFGVLLYEMLIGQSPFSGCDEDELFWSICNEMPSYPRFLSQQALTILTRLLDKDAKSRLGGVECMHGDVRDQDFFHSIQWDRLERRELEAPFKPRVRHPLDTQYFDRAFTGERPRLTAVEPAVLRSMDQAPFRGFSYTNPNATDR